ncbi:unannotated protein [freshwater metagenome]|uniref:Unannotated protein n=1 Tax=freshwater metagenome TaxID=449393 RepID=A0A6J6GQY6_9ZZZZ|nr:DUF3048 domain-containing protein [Actinomycetota bacterium]
MRSKKILLSFTAMVLLAGCASAKPQVEETKPEITYNSISGRIGTDGPVLAVKVDDTSLSRPQIGIDQADLVYIELVEGGLTRLATIFSSVIPQNIGPVRSARISDIEILSQFGKVVFAYSGAQRPMYPVISSANLWDYGAQHSSPTIYTRDQTRFAPYNLVLRADLLLEKVLKDQRAVAKSKSPGWTFGDIPTGGVAVDSVTVRWPASKYEATWSSSEKRWLFSNGGKPDMAASGSQLGATTFVIQDVEISNSIYKGKFGTYTPFSQTIGTGTGYVLRDGRSFKANWSRPTAESGTSWTLADGSEIKFAPGSVWVALTDQKPEFTLTAPATPVSK